MLCSQLLCLLFFKIFDKILLIVMHQYAALCSHGNNDRYRYKSKRQYGKDYDRYIFHIVTPLMK